MDEMLNVEKMETQREKLGLSQTDAADAAGLKSKQAWNNIVRGGQTNITLKTLYGIAAALKMKPKDLLK